MLANPSDFFLQKHEKISINCFNPIEQPVILFIDKNLTLKLCIRRIKTLLVFEGIILYRNGQELKLSCKSWEIVTKYSQLQNNNVLFLNNFNEESIEISSKISFFPNSPSLPFFIKQHCEKILQDVKSFSSILYRYGLVRLSGKFFFRQILKEFKLKKQIMSQLTQPLLKDSQKSFTQSHMASNMIDQQEQQIVTPRIQICSIKPLLAEDAENQYVLPNQLLSGPKNIKLNFQNSKEGSIISGGFFDVQRIFCRIQKFLQTSIKSNHQCVNQNGEPNESDFFLDNVVGKSKLEILVRKTLKQTNKQSKFNALKISKELTIIEQIKNPAHILVYYKNRNSSIMKNREKNYPSLTEQKAHLWEKTKCSDVSNKSIQENLKFRKEFKYESQIYMEFHPHTLKNIIDKKWKSRQEQLSTCLELLEAISHLHESYVIHRDIKPENVLIDYNTNRTKPILKIIDFAESSIYIDPNTGQRFQNPRISKEAIRQFFDANNKQLLGATLPYSPPECQSQRSKRTSIGVNSKKIDSWSIGMILPEIYYGKKFVNFPKPYAHDIINVIKHSGFETYNSKVKKRGFQILESLITYVGAKNIFYSQDVRLDVTNCFKAFTFLKDQYRNWALQTKDLNPINKFQVPLIDEEAIRVK